MKVLIVGSVDDDAGESKKKEFINVCLDIGRELCQNGHEIVVGSDSPNTADFHVFNGFILSQNAHKVIVARWDDGKTPFSEYRNGNVQFTYSRHRGRLGSSRVHQILTSDVVLVIGGEKGALDVTNIAPELGRPVLAIPVTEGAARDAWQKFERDYRSLKSVSSRIGDLAEEWKPDNGKLSVEVLEELVKHNPYRHKLTAPQFALLAFLLLLFSCWICLFIYPLSPKNLTAFILLTISSLMGATLRTELDQIANPELGLEWSNIIAGMVVGIILSFGLSLVYFSVGITFTGKFEFITLTENIDYVRVSIILSLLGLSSSLLIEPSVERLRSWLRHFINE